jgi:hypothetical protein
LPCDSAPALPRNDIIEIVSMMCAFKIGENWVR